jgi:intracellular septation protein
LGGLFVGDLRVDGRNGARCRPPAGLVHRGLIGLHRGFIGPFFVNRRGFTRTMQFLFELAPVIAFVVAYVTGGIYVATATIMIAMAVVLAVDYLRTRRIPKMHGLSAVLVWVFGAATLILHDIRFIQWKPTVFYWLVAITFLGSMWIGKQPLLQTLMTAALEGALTPGEGEPEKLQISDASWRRANLLFVVFYALLGVANLVLVFHTTEAVWAKSKLAFVVVLFVFTAGQFFWLMRKQQPEQSPSAQA